MDMVRKPDKNCCYDVKWFKLLTIQSWKLDLKNTFFLV